MDIRLSVSDGSTGIVVRKTLLKEEKDIVFRETENDILFSLFLYFMAIYKVRKRNGAIVTFDRTKIEHAIRLAIEAVGGTDFSRVSSFVDQIIMRIEEKTGSDIPNIELIQDTVEEVLIKDGHDTVAKAYIVYRAKRAEARSDEAIVVEVGKTMNEYLEKSDWRVNANANSGYSLGGLILNTSGKITANYWLSHIYPSEVGNTHRNGDYHIHDLDMFS